MRARARAKARTWSKSKSCVSYDLQQINHKAIACCAAVSERGGLDLLMMWEKSVNTEKFHTFLKRLRAKYPFRKMCLYMDNLGLHKSKSTRKIYDEQRFRYIFNPSFSPFGNCIEECFAQSKHRFKKLRLQNMMNGGQQSNEEMIELAFERVNKDLV